MSLKLNQIEVMGLRNRAVGLMNRVRKAAEKVDEQVATGVEALVTTGTAFGLGVAQGRYGGVELFQVPVDLAAGIGLHVLGFSGLAKSGTKHVHAAANGALACYAATLGRGVGSDWRAKSEGGSAPAQLPPAAASGHTISDAELARMARAA